MKEMGLWWSIGRSLCLTILFCASACSSEAPGQASTDGAEREAAQGTDLASSDNRVIGTIEASIDGSERTWYVLEAEVGGELQRTAFWHEPEPGAARVMITGYDTPDVAFEDPGSGGTPLGAYDGSGITLVVAFRPGEDSKSMHLTDADATKVLYMPLMAGGEGSSLFQIVDGELDVANLRAPRSGTGEIEGSFSGTMRDLFGSDQKLTVTDGRFEVKELMYQEELPGGGGLR